MNSEGNLDIRKGYLMVDPMVTPIMNLWNGPTAGRNFTLFTGRGWDSNNTLETFIDEIGAIRSSNNDRDSP
jgi:hypothetical protein